MSIAAHLIWLLPYFVLATIQSTHHRRARWLVLWLPQALAAAGLLMGLASCLALFLAEEISRNFGPSTTSPWVEWMTRPDAFSASLLVSLAGLATILVASSLVLWASGALATRRRTRPA